ncbi:restriction endonuclease subunit S [Phascolarctobacterium succinatutens]|uniref:restriction endonuclease subunit S n=1 Tax=Phascolarctobacterium succinatutens TaxID=626940 RepID=UPI0026F13072|nr:restriction endonuclease subunit S [Phascolarctobacterium succinatutens]
MTTQELKNSILQLAIAGKLVEQRAEEGTAEELFAQIQAEKQKLVAEGKLKKQKPLPEITEEEKPFDIPESWKWVRFQDLMLEISTGPFGSMLHKTDYIANGIPLVNPANIINSRIVESDKMMISEETANRLGKYRLSSGMIVMGRRGEMGRCAIVEPEQNGWVCGTGSFFMNPSKSLHLSYMIKLFSTVYAKAYLAGESVGTTMSNLNHTILRSIPIPLPPLAEQKRIVAKIEQLLPYIDRYEKAWSRLQEFNKRFPSDMQKSLLQYAIEGKLVKQRAEEGTAEELFAQIQAEKQRLVAEGKLKKQKPLPEMICTQFSGHR